MKLFCKFAILFAFILPFGFVAADTHDDATMDVIEHSSADHYENEIELPEPHDNDDHDKNHDSHDDKDDSHDGKDDSHDDKDDSSDDKDDSQDDKDDSSDDKDDDDKNNS